MLRARFLKTLFTGAALIAATVGVSTLAHAQFGPTAEFEIPFAFDVSGKSMPAGKYNLIARSPQIISLMHRVSGASVLSASSGLLSSVPKARLTFVKAGQSYSLESADLMGRVGRWRIESKPMSILVAGTDGPDRVVLFARR